MLPDDTQPWPAAVPNRSPWLFVLAAACALAILVAVVAGLVTAKAKRDLDLTKQNLTSTRTALQQERATRQGTQKSLDAITSELSAAKVKLNAATGTSQSSTKTIADLRTCLAGYNTIETLLGEGNNDEANNVVDEIRGACVRAEAIAP